MSTENMVILVVEVEAELKIGGKINIMNKVTTLG
jgi:hypothetical protein